jgi:signal transduction histidine kinase
MQRAHLERLVEERTEELAAANEELEAASETKDRFLASISHELRTPLNSILGFSGVLLQGMAGELNEEQRRQVQMMNNSGRQLLELVNDVLDLAKITSGTVPLHLAKVDVSDVVERSAAVFRPGLADRGIPLEVRLMCKDPVIESDERRLGQILLNVLSNAEKYTEGGSVTVVVREDGDDRIAIDVRDTGIGISQEHLPHVFDEFYQIEHPRPSTDSGTGLGLAICARLATQLGGEITAKSRLRAGSVFTLRLPVRWEGAPSEAPEAAVGHAGIVANAGDAEDADSA